MGLGYVGLPVAVALAKKWPVVGLDIKSERIEQLKQGIDTTGEVGSAELASVSSNMQLTTRLESLKEANFHIITVPTPIDKQKNPDMSILLEASRMIGQVIKKDDIVVYESTVYPGATEEDCIPAIEESSGLTAGVDFKVGYSPERISPGDKERSFTKIKKVVSAQDCETLERMANIYASVIDAGVVKAQSIKIAEAAKIVENVQRDINISLMNELSIIFDKLDIDTLSVLDIASSKWNFLKFYPGLVGGHCIGVDPYYLTYQAKKAGHDPQVILSGRKINDEMGKFVAQKTMRRMAQRGQKVQDSKVAVLGLTFKENCSDLRNTKVIDLINELKDHGVNVQVSDPKADPKEAKECYGVELVPFERLEKSHAVIVTVAHDYFKSLGVEDLKKIMEDHAILFDLKGIYCKQAIEENKIEMLRL